MPGKSFCPKMYTFSWWFDEAHSAVLMSTRAASGDTHLGGEDFDQRVMEYFIKLIKRKYSVDVSGDKRALQKLRREAERAKRALSSQHQVGPFCSYYAPLPPPILLLAHAWTT